MLLSNYVITFFVFPGPTTLKTFNFSATWSAIIFVMMFNLGDISGKYMVVFKGIFNKASTIYLLLARLYFVFTITILATRAVDNDILMNNVVFPFINQFLFGLSNGLLTSTLLFKKTAASSSPSQSVPPIVGNMLELFVGYSCS